MCLDQKLSLAELLLRILSSRTLPKCTQVKSSVICSSSSYSGKQVQGIFLRNGVFRHG
jgi:hypothetical protein